MMRVEEGRLYQLDLAPGDVVQAVAYASGCSISDSVIWAITEVADHKWIGSSLTCHGATLVDSFTWRVLSRAERVALEADTFTLSHENVEEREYRFGYELLAGGPRVDIHHGADNGSLFLTDVDDDYVNLWLENNAREDHYRRRYQIAMKVLPSVIRAHDGDGDEIARKAYAIADAMLAESGR